MPKVARMYALPRVSMTEVSPLRLPWIVLRIYFAGASQTRRLCCRGPRDRRASGKRSQYDGDACWIEHRHFNGFHTSRRLVMGTAAATSMPEHSLFVRAGKNVSPAARHATEQTIRLAGSFRFQRGHAGPAAIGGQGRCHASEAIELFCYRRKNTSAPMPQRSAASTYWSSPEASVRKQRRADRICRASNFWAFR